MEKLRFKEVRKVEATNEFVKFEVGIERIFKFLGTATIEGNYGESECLRVKEVVNGYLEDNEKLIGSYSALQLLAPRLEVGRFYSITYIGDEPSKHRRGKTFMKFDVRLLELQ